MSLQRSHGKSKSFVWDRVCVGDVMVIVDFRIFEVEFVFTDLAFAVRFCRFAV